MKVVIGLGNPGLEYRNTRHNIGFEVLAELSTRFGGGHPKLAFDSETVDVLVGSEKVILAAPQTFMNRSGRAVRKLVDFYKLPVEDILVVCDDLNLENGRLRLRPKGSAGGQKGLKDIISHLGTEEFTRLRIGIGRPPGRMKSSDFVLSRFSKEERSTVDVAVMQGADAVQVWIESGTPEAMNRFNADPSKRDD